MNERIKQLALQATRQYSPTYYTQEWIQGFALLIVRECIDAALEAQADFYVVNNIKQHFEVELTEEQRIAKIQELDRRNLST